MDNSVKIVDVLQSEYVKSLSHEDSAFYIEKLTIDDVILPDPYGIPKADWTNNVNEWPEISLLDIYEYFVKTSCLYSMAEVKNVKSLDGFQYFILGHVQQVLFHKPDIKDYVYLMADIMPSQRQSKKKDFYKTYIIAERNGTILTAHCTCMAGSGKACSHAAALAYKVDGLRKLKHDEAACTSVLCSWNDMSKKKATPAMLEEIDFQRPRYGRTMVAPPVSEDSFSTVSQKRQPETRLTDSRLDKLRKITPNAAALTCIDVKKQPPLPLTPIEVFHGLQDIDGIDFLEALSSSLSAESIDRLNKLTIKQAKSNLWLKHRKGRITGSRMHIVYRIKENTSRENMLKSIFGLSPDVKTHAMLYGITNEDVARKTYCKFQADMHQDFKCELSGLVLNQRYPHLGSSPDGIVECKCCGKGCLEIKCLVKYKDGLPGPIFPDDPQYPADGSREVPFIPHDSSYPIDENCMLKKTHPYYTQVQGHMLITDLKYCDIYLWSKSRSIAVRVERDNEFMKELYEKLTKEYLTYVVPKIFSMTN